MSSTPPPYLWPKFDVSLLSSQEIALYLKFILKQTLSVEEGQRLCCMVSPLLSPAARLSAEDANLINKSLVYLFSNDIPIVVLDTVLKQHQSFVQEMVYSLVSDFIQADFGPRLFVLPTDISLSHFFLLVHVAVLHPVICEHGQVKVAIRKVVSDLLLLVENPPEVLLLDLLRLILDSRLCELVFDKTSLSALNKNAPELLVFIQFFLWFRFREDGEGPSADMQTCFISVLEYTNSSLPLLEVQKEALCFALGRLPIHYPVSLLFEMSKHCRAIREHLFRTRGQQLFAEADENPLALLTWFNLCKETPELLDVNLSYILLRPCFDKATKRLGLSRLTVLASSPENHAYLYILPEFHELKEEAVYKTVSQSFVEKQRLVLPSAPGVSLPLFPSELLVSSQMLDKFLTVDLPCSQLARKIFRQASLPIWIECLELKRELDGYVQQIGSSPFVENDLPFDIQMACDERDACREKLVKLCPLAQLKILETDLDQLLGIPATFETGQSTQVFYSEAEILYKRKEFAFALQQLLGLEEEQIRVRLYKQALEASEFIIKQRASALVSSSFVASACAKAKEVVHGCHSLYKEPDLLQRHDRIVKDLFPLVRKLKLTVADSTVEQLEGKLALEKMKRNGEWSPTAGNAIAHRLSAVTKYLEQSEKDRHELEVQVSQLAGCDFPDLHYAVQRLWNAEPRKSILRRDSLSHRELLLSGTQYQVGVLHICVEDEEKVLRWMSKEEDFNIPLLLSRRVKHLSILSCEGVFWGEDHVALQFPWLPGGTLLEWISQNPKANLLTRLNILSRIASAVEALHEAGIVHRAISPAHIQMDANGTPRIDFFDQAKDLNGFASSTESEQLEWKQADVLACAKLSQLLLVGFAFTLLHPELALVLENLLQTHVAVNTSAKEFSLLLTKRKCNLDMDCDECVVDQGFVCSNFEHFFCRTDFEEYVTNVCLQNLPALDSEDYIPCPVCEPSSGGTFSDQYLANLSPPVYNRYRKWRTQCVEARVTRNTDSRIKTAVLATLNKSPLDVQMELAEQELLELMLNRCSTCQTPYILDKGCLAMRCDSCKSWFCFYCQAVSVGSKENHTHVASCKLNPKPGHVFLDENVLDEFIAQRRRHAITKSLEKWSTSTQELLKQKPSVQALLKDLGVKE